MNSCPTLSVKISKCVFSHVLITCIEIISPGHLPDNLTVAKIRAGNSNIRNPILVSYTAKGLLPYRGPGSGIKRALGKWLDIDFIDERDKNLFTVIIHRKNAIE